MSNLNTVDDCLFCKISSGVIPADVVMETQSAIAFRDIDPKAPTHVLVIPKVETDKFFDLKDEYLTEILLFAKPIAKAIEAGFQCNRCGISVIGLEVPHAHVHLVPMNRMLDINFSQEKLKPSQESLAATAEKIRSYLL